jgi:hypothetical protein
MNQFPRRRRTFSLVEGETTTGRAAFAVSRYTSRSSGKYSSTAHLGITGKSRESSGTPGSKR